MFVIDAPDRPPPSCLGAAGWTHGALSAGDTPPCLRGKPPGGLAPCGKGESKVEQSWAAAAAAVVVVGSC